MTRHRTQPADPLSGFPAEAEMERRSARSRLVRGVLAAAVAVSALVIVAALAVPRFIDAGRAAGAPHATLRIETSPAGARVSSGGRVLGATPLSLSLPPGPHVFALEQDGVSRSLSLQLEAGAEVVHHVEMPRPTHAAARQMEAEPAAPVVPPAPPRRAEASGWLVLAAPIELQVLEAGALVGSSRTDRIVLRAGEHRLRLVNQRLGFQADAVVYVRPGETTRATVPVPSGAISVNAIPWAEVLIDGTRVGDTPIAHHELPIGSHEVTLRNPKFPEQRRRVTVTLSAPVRLGVDMRR